MLLGSSSGEKNVLGLYSNPQIRLLKKHDYRIMSCAMDLAKMYGLK
jgi:hypothetical protein